MLSWLQMGRRALLVCALLCVGAFGCHNTDAGALSDTQKQQADRLAKISKESGGDWQKVSEPDKQFILTTLANGDEHTAQILIKPPPGASGGGAMGSPGHPPTMPGAPSR